MIIGVEQSTMSAMAYLNLISSRRKHCLHILPATFESATHVTSNAECIR